MRKTLLIGLVLGFLVAMSCVSEAELLRISGGTMVTTYLAQTSPTPFADPSYWGGLGLSVLFRSISLGASISLADVETLTINQHPTISFIAVMKLAQISVVTVGIQGAINICPYYSWTAPSVGFRITLASVIPFTEIYAVPHIVWTEGGTGGTPAGRAVGISVGISVFLPLF